jgi:hypothetical protein
MVEDVVHADGAHQAMIIIDHHQAHGFVAGGADLGVEDFFDGFFHGLVHVDGIVIFGHDISGKQLHGSHSLAALMVTVAADGRVGRLKVV